MLSAVSRSGLAARGLAKSKVPSLASFNTSAMRFKSDDAGDVIGIDLGTTNSCVAIMVSILLKWKSGRGRKKWKKKEERGRERREKRIGTRRKTNAIKRPTKIHSKPCKST